MQGMENARKLPNFCRAWKMQGIICIIAGIGKCKDGKCKQRKDRKIQRMEIVRNGKCKN